MLISLCHFKKNLLSVFVIFSLALNAQHAAKIDSLKRKLQENIHDTIRVKTLTRLAHHALQQGEHKQSLEWALQSMELAEKIQFNRILGNVYNGVANSYVGLSDYPKGMEYHQKALKNRIERNDKPGISGSYNNIAIIYYNLADFTRSLDYFQRSLKMQEELKNEYFQAACIGNIAVIYGNLKEDSLSMVYQQKSFDMHEKMGNKTDMVASLNNLGELTRKKNQLEKSLSYFKRALEIAKTLDEREGLKNTLGNIGVNYLMMKKPKEALEMILEAKKLNEAQSDKKDESILFTHMAEAYSQMGKKEEAIQFYQQAYDLAKGIGSLKEQKSAAEGLYNSYKEKNDFKNAMVFLETAKKLNDSIFNSNTTESLNSLKTQFALDRQEVILNQKAEEETKKQNEEKARQRTAMYIAIGVLGLVLIFSYFLYQRFRITRKQNKIIEHQKLIVEEKNKEITDSILYAKRLQQAITPPVELVHKNFPDSFIYFQPKDIIAGDFYWMEIVDGSIYLAVADCTGHGVPGAMVSVVCSNALNRAVKEFALTHTGNILDKTRELVLETFARSDEDIKDGMDISLLKFNGQSQKTKEDVIEIEWSGANNSLWYIENGQFKTIKCDKQPIGKSDHPKPFTTHSVKLPKNTSLYLYTDGFADQFGGSKGKKFKYKQLEDLLLSINNLPGKEQSTALKNAFEGWKGNLEQVDDVCVIGIKI